MITVQLKVSDYLEAVAFNRRWKATHWLVKCIYTIALLLVGISSLASPDTSIIGIIFICLAILDWVVPAIMIFIVRPRLFRKRFEQGKLQHPFTVSWSEGAFIFKGETEESTTLWSDILKWCETEHLFLIFVNKSRFHIIPKRLFGAPDDVTAFRKLLHHNIGLMDMSRRNTNAKDKASARAEPRNQKQ